MFEKKSTKGLILIYKCLKVIVYSFLIAFIAFYFFCGYYTSNKYPIKYKEEVFSNAEYYELDKALVFSVIKTESNFNAKAVSKKGAVGLMQIKPETANYIAQMQGVKEYDLYDFKTNINFGCFYLKYLLNKFEVVDTVLCAYNAGEGNVNLWLASKDYSADGKTLKKIPFEETERYVKKTKRATIKYEKLLGNIVDK